MSPKAGAKSGTQNPSSAAWDPLGGVAMQTQMMQSFQNWSDTLLQTFREQVEGQLKMLSSVHSSLEAMEAALASQEATNKALRESLEGYRQMVGGASAAQENYVRLIKAALDTLAETVSNQFQAAQGLSGPMAEPLKAMQELSEQWLVAYRRLLEPPSSSKSSGT
jgi:hypothetical protein